VNLRSAPGLVLAVVAAVALHAQPPSNPLAFFQPLVAPTPEELQRLNAGQPLVKTLSGEDRQIGVFAAMSVTATPGALAARVRNIASFKKNPYVRAIRRFSDPPLLEDLAGLTVNDGDLDDIRRCRPSAASCKVKLAPEEIERLHHALSAVEPAVWKPALQDAFRQLVLDRVRAYQTDGTLPYYLDDDGPVRLQEAFSTLLRSQPVLWQRAPRFAAYLEQYPRAPMPGVESFWYWSKEDFGRKANISVTQVSILPDASPDGQPEILIASKQIFATHYVDASLGLTTMLRGTDDSRMYLAYLNLSQVDVLSGLFKGLKRALIERRIRGETETIMTNLRTRLEGPDDGDP
jgi:hypothetical protein